jgi:hypothetical protein
MSRAERARWAAKREKYEDAVIADARAAGRLPVIDCTAKGYPIPPAILRQLVQADDPDRRERVCREAALLRRKSVSLRSLALVLERDGKPQQAEAMKQKASAQDQQADALDESVAPL